MFSHAGSRPPGVAPVEISLAGRLSRAARRAVDHQFSDPAASTTVGCRRARLRPGCGRPSARHQARHTPFPGARLPSRKGLMDRERPPAEVGLGVHMPTLPGADRGIPQGGVAPVNGRVPRSGNTVPAAVSQLQESQPYTEALARTWKWRFGAHAPRCLMCTRRSAPTRADPRS